MNIVAVFKLDEEYEAIKEIMIKKHLFFSGKTK